MLKTKVEDSYAYILFTSIHFMIIISCSYKDKKSHHIPPYYELNQASQGFQFIPFKFLNEKHNLHVPFC